MLLMPMRVLFLCTGNSARSQIAEGLLRRLGGDRFEALSAGTSPRPEVNPLAVEVMRAHGIDIAGHRPKDLTGIDRVDVAITVCDNAKESCPVFPGARMIHWSLPDPTDRASFEDTYAKLEERIRRFIAECR